MPLTRQLGGDIADLLNRAQAHCRVACILAEKTRPAPRCLPALPPVLRDTLAELETILVTAQEIVALIRAEPWEQPVSPSSFSHNPLPTRRHPAVRQSAQGGHNRD